MQLLSFPFEKKLLLVGLLFVFSPFVDNGVGQGAGSDLSYWRGNNPPEKNPIFQHLGGMKWLEFEADGKTAGGLWEQTSLDRETGTVVLFDKSRNYRTKLTPTLTEIMLDGKKWVNQVKGGWGKPPSSPLPGDPGFRFKVSTFWKGMRENGNVRYFDNIGGKYWQEFREDGKSKYALWIEQKRTSESVFLLDKESGQHLQLTPTGAIFSKNGETLKDLEGTWRDRPLLPIPADPGYHGEITNLWRGFNRPSDNLVFQKVSQSEWQEYRKDGAERARTWVVTSSGNGFVNLSATNGYVLELSPTKARITIKGNSSTLIEGSWATNSIKLKADPGFQAKVTRLWRGFNSPESNLIFLQAGSKDWQEFHRDGQKKTTMWQEKSRTDEAVELYDIDRGYNLTLTPTQAFIKTKENPTGGILIKGSWAFANEELLEENESVLATSVLEDFPMGPGYALGAPVRFPSGQVCGKSAVKPFQQPAEGNPKNISSRYKWVSDSSSFSSAFSLDSSVSGTYSGVTGSFKSKVMNQTSFGSLTKTLIASTDIEWPAPTLSSTSFPELTDEAKELLDDPEAFRTRYGDYFIGGFKRVARYSAVFTLSSEDRKSLVDVENEIGVEAPAGAAKSDVSTKLSTSTAQKNVKVEAKVVMQGVEGNADVSNPLPKDPKMIDESNASFQKNAIGAKIQPILYHYSLLSDKIKPRIPLNQSKLNLASKIFSRIASLRATKDRPTSRAYDQKLKSIGQRVSQIDPNLSVPYSDLAAINSEIDRLVVFRNRAMQTEWFYQKLAKQSNLTSGDGDKRPLFKAGSEPGDIPGEIFVPVTLAYQHTWTSPTGQGITVLLPGKGEFKDVIICGYEFTPQRESGIRGSFKVEGGGLNEKFVKVTFSPPGDTIRNTVWEMKVWVVPEKEQAMNQINKAGLLLNKQ